MKATRIIAALVTAVALSLCATERAHAGPLFTLPDTSFTGPAGSILFNTGFIIHADTTQGAAFSTNFGSGFVANSPAQLDVNVLGLGNKATGQISLESKLGNVNADVIRASIRNGLSGKEALVFARVTSSTMQGVNVGMLLGLDAFSFRILGTNNVEGLGVKGDVAPVIPEPATLSLVVLGLGGLMASARRKLCLV